MFKQKKNSSKTSKTNETPSDGTVKIGGKPITPKAVKNSGGGSVARAIEEGVNAKPAKSKEPKTTTIKKQTVKEVIGDDHFSATEQWEKVEGTDNTYEAYAVTLVDGDMAKFTGEVKFGGTWYDLRTFKFFKDEDDKFYLSQPETKVPNGVTLKVII